MSVPKTKRYARNLGKTSSLATAKLAIFATDILWESCFKLDLEQLFNGHLYIFFAFFAVTMQIVFIATNDKK